MKYYLTETPHSTYRVFVSKDILENEDAVKLLNFLSCWNGIDKKTDNLVSWEFSNLLPMTYVERALGKFGYEQVEYLDW